MEPFKTQSHPLKRVAFAALCALAVVAFMGKSYETSLQALDSTTHAVLAQRVAGQGLKPVLPIQNFTTNQIQNPIFNDHPFTLFYLSGQVMRMLGPAAWTAKLIPTAFSVGCLMLVAWLGTLIFSAPAGLMAGLILMLSRDFVLIGTRFHLDTPMVFFILLSFGLMLRNKPLWAGVAAGLGIWMKSPVALLMFPSVGVALLVTGNLTKKKFTDLFLSAVIALIVGSGIWLLMGTLGGWGWVADYWKRQVWGTAVAGRGTGGGSDFHFGFFLLRHHYLPWFWLVLASLVWIGVKRQFKRFEIAMLIAAVVILEGVIGAMHFKHYWYYVPVFPFLALIAVSSLNGALMRWESKVYAGVIALGLLVPTLLVATPISLGPDNFPAIRRFSPIIQEFGSCEDQVLFINGGQPFGSDLDSAYELGFYTGRKILHGECDEGKRLIDQLHPAWIVVTGENREKCVSKEAGSSYPVEYRFGNQYLISRVVPKDRVNDLTPLARELKAPDHCIPVAYPDDPYFPRSH